MKKVLISLALLAFSLISSAAMAANEVGLVRATSMISYYRGFSSHDGLFEVQISNLAANKLVFVHVRTSNGSWVDYPLSYAYSGGSGKEVWNARFSNGNWAGSPQNLPDTGDTMVFAVKYQVNGSTYWDNNKGANYSITRGAGTLLGAGLNLSVANYTANAIVASGNILSGNVTLRNIGLNKKVEIVYSTDHWLTRKVASAKYVPIWTQGYSQVANPNALGFEEWVFEVNVGAATQLEYAASYTINGQTFWDNNFGRNYVSKITHQ